LCIFGLGAEGERSVLGPDHFTQREAFATPFGLEASCVQTAQDTAWREDRLAFAENRTPNFSFQFRSLDTVLTEVFQQAPPPPSNQEGNQFKF
jgi:hypothetical protein